MMLCDELKPLVFSIADLAYVDEILVTKNFQNPHDHAVYKATEVDAAIAELKARINELESIPHTDNSAVIDALETENAELKADSRRLKKKMDDYHLMSDIRRAKIKELKRALWLARAYRGYDNSILLPSKFMRKVWDYVERKCRAKAEEYK